LLVLGAFGSGDIVSTAFGGLSVLTGMTRIAGEQWKIQKRERYSWLRPIKGLCQI